MTQRPSPNSGKHQARTETRPATARGQRTHLHRQPVKASRPRARTAVPSTPRFSRRAKVFAGIIAAVCIALAGLVFASSMNASRTQNVAAATGGGTYPWPADPPGLESRLQAATLPALTAEGTALHIHDHLDLYIHGQQVPVPADIGIDQSAGILSPLHTHDDTGVIHVESPTIQDYFLGQFFQVWGVQLNSNCIGGYCKDADNSIQMWVNGQPYTGDPGTLKLAAHQEIVIAYGSTAETPTNIPSSYQWNGL